MLIYQTSKTRRMLIPELLEARLRQSPEFAAATRQGWQPWLFVRHYPHAQEDVNLDSGTFEFWWAFSEGPTQAELDCLTSAALAIIRDALGDRLDTDVGNRREDYMERPEVPFPSIWFKFAVSP
jgi:hypothetical protein